MMRSGRSLGTSQEPTYKGNGIDITAGLLEKVRVLFCQRRPMDTWTDGSESREQKKRGIGKEDRIVKQALLVCMEDIERQGFDYSQVEDSVRYVMHLVSVDRQKREGVMYEPGRGTTRNVSSLAHVLIMLVMNDLLSRLTREELPSYYADLSKSLDQARVKHVPSNEVVCKSLGGSSRVDDQEEFRPREGDEILLDKDAQTRDKEEEAERQGTERKEDVPIERKDKEQSKAWILQRAYCSSDEGDSCDGTFSDGDNGSIEDWEIWGSPEEIERRKAEKARNMLSREDKIAILAHDMYRAKDDAAVAKANKDKDGQKQAGAIIGRLRRDMKELGIGDEDLEAFAPPDARAVQPKGPREEAGMGSGDDGICKTGASLPSSDSDEHQDGFDLFGDDAPEQPQSNTVSHMAYASIILNKRLREAVCRRGKGGSKGMHTKATPRKHPKAILQQLVQKDGWGAPRFEKLSTGNEKSNVGVQYRFQILVDIKQTKRALHALRPGIHRFVLPPELDGWDTIQQAQDACATKALMELYGATGEVLWESLVEPFDALVFDIAEHQNPEASPSDLRVQERESFVDSLLASVTLRNVTLQDDSIDESRRHARDQEILDSISEKKTQLAKDQAKEVGRRLNADFTDWKRSENGSCWMQKRSMLPVSQIRESLLEALEMHDVVLVSGETGSGKTTQVPQIVLDGCIESFCGDKCSIVCTQPRRIAAISVAERVAEERGEAGPGKRGCLVGYSVRFDSATSPATRLEFCTTGILLRRLSSDPALAKLSHIIVDEVHERTMQSDFLIAMLRDLVKKRRQAGLPLKVILMSATMNTQMVSDYFNKCPILNASGRTFPVKHLFLEDVYEITQYVLDMDSPAAVKGYQALRGRQIKLENSSGSKNKAIIKSNWGDDIGDVILNEHFDESLYSKNYSSQTIRNLSRLNEDKIDMDLLEHTVLYIHKTQQPGAILVFVPGMGEIDNLSKRLLSQRALQGHVIVPLHSSISSKDQRNAFQIHPPEVRKIVISTNIAETSVTIEDIVYVIDTGKHKERRHDASRSMSMLVEDTISVANANQRKGRAGRVREGVCYSLYTNACYEQRMKKYQTPEIMRVPLEEMILQIHYLNLSNTADEFLSKVLQPPQPKSVIAAVANLVQAGALTKQEDLTALGGHLAQLPVDVNIGKILIMGTLLSCLSPVLSIAACLSHKSPFTASQNKDEMRAMAAPFLSKDKKFISSEQQSDHLVLAAALQGWIDAKASGGIAAAKKYSKKYSLSVQNIGIIMEMRDQFATMLENVGLAQRGEAKDAQRMGPAWYDSETCPQNIHKTSPYIVRAALVASLYPNIAVIDDFVPGGTPTWHDGAGSVTIHPTSLLAGISAGALQRHFIVFSEKMKTTRIFVRDCTVASPLSILLFGGHIQVDHRSGIVLVDGWIKIKIPGRSAAILLQLREEIEEILQIKVKNSRRDWEISMKTAMDAVSELLKQEQEMLAWHA